MTITWAAFTFLSGAQRTALQAFADFASQVKAVPQRRGLPVLVPPDTFQHAKAAKAGITEMNVLLNDTLLAVDYTLAYYRRLNEEQAKAAFEAANP